MNRATLKLIKQALEYHKQGDPIKDVFPSGIAEQEAVIAAFEYVSANFGKPVRSSVPQRNVRSFCDD